MGDQNQLDGKIEEKIKACVSLVLSHSELCFAEIAWTN